jgi:hypothetical protein
MLYENVFKFLLFLGLVISFAICYADGLVINEIIQNLKPILQ